MATDDENDFAARPRLNGVSRPHPGLQAGCLAVDEGGPHDPADRLSGRQLSWPAAEEPLGAGLPGRQTRSKQSQRERLDQQAPSRILKPAEAIDASPTFSRFLGAEQALNSKV